MAEIFRFLCSLGKIHIINKIKINMSSYHCYYILIMENDITKSIIDHIKKKVILPQMLTIKSQEKNPTVIHEQCNSCLAFQSVFVFYNFLDSISLKFLTRCFQGHMILVKVGKSMFITQLKITTLKQHYSRPIFSQQYSPNKIMQASYSYYK